MKTRILRIFFAAVLLSVVLLAAGFAIAYFLTDSTETTGFVLFVIGAIPIFLYIPTLFTRSASGSLHTPKVIYRLVDTLERRKDGNYDVEERKAEVASAVSIILAGVIVWCVSFFMHV